MNAIYLKYDVYYISGAGITKFLEFHLILYNYRTRSRILFFKGSILLKRDKRFKYLIIYF